MPSQHERGEDDNATRDRNVARVKQFFQCERALDASGWGAMLADDAVRRTPFAPEGMPKETRGRGEILRIMQPLFEQARELAVDDEVFPLQDPDTVVARAHVRAALQNGHVYENELVAFFRFDDRGEIVELTAFLDPAPILKLLGR